MTTDPNASVHAHHLRALLDSDLPDPALVLREGRIEVVSADERAGLQVVSRAELLHDAGSDTFTDTELDQHATALATLGG